MYRLGPSWKLYSRFSIDSWDLKGSFRFESVFWDGFRVKSISFHVKKIKIIQNIDFLLWGTWSFRFASFVFCEVSQELLRTVERALLGICLVSISSFRDFLVPCNEFLIPVFWFLFFGNSDSEICGDIVF